MKHGAWSVMGVTVVGSLALVACFGQSGGTGGDGGFAFDASHGDVSVDGPSGSDAAPSDASEAGGGDAGLEGGTTNLGRVWHELEEQGTCNGLWTRQGQTPTFTSVWANCGGTTATITITIVGTAVTAQRTQDSGGNDCTYTGTLSADGLSVTGTYHCALYNPPAPGAWSATIDYGTGDGGTDAASDAPADAPTDAPTDAPSDG